MSRDVRALDEFSPDDSMDQRVLALKLSPITPRVSAGSCDFIIYRTW